MNPALRCLTFAVVVVAGLSPATPSFSQERPTKALVNVSLLTTSRVGATGSPSSSNAMSLAVGETNTSSVYANFTGSREAGGWPIGVGGDGYAWRVEARLISVHVDTVEVAINWGRYRPLTGSEAREAGDTRVIALKTNERHVLDLVQSDKPGSTGVNLILEVEARQIEDPAFAKASIGYDLWLVYQDRAGARTARRMPMVGGQGELKPLAFQSLGFALDGKVMVAESDAPITLSLEGAILGRLRPDGAIDVVVAALLQLGCGPGSSGGGGGQKKYVARDGETVGVELPFGYGQCTLNAGTSIPPNARPGVSARADGAVRVVKQEFFKGDKLSLLVTARRTK